MNHEQNETHENEDTKQRTFEEAMSELEQIVEKLEAGDVALEEAVQLFQQGMQLSKTCHDKLQKVEKQVHILTEENGELQKKEFHLEEDPE